MTVENIGASAWVVQLSNSEAEDMGCRGESCGVNLADKAAELTGCGTNCAAQIYYGHGEILLFLTERDTMQALFHFTEFEAVLTAVQMLQAQDSARLYATDDGYILAFTGQVPHTVWDHGRPVPYSALKNTELLAENAVSTLKNAFHL